MSREPEWDFFLAHAGEDKAIAEALYAHLAEHRRVFLDSKCLKLGDNWDERLADAQRVSRVTVVLVSEKTQRAYYQREEIAAAIAMARHDPGDHRVVPIYLDGQPDELSPIPYGLRLKHGLVLAEAGGASGVAEQLRTLLGQLPTPASANAAPQRGRHDQADPDLDRALRDTIRQQRALRRDGGSTSEIDATIVDLKRKIRGHGISLSPGDHLLSGRFELDRHIGHGSFGDVWRAYDEDAAGKLVAIKVLHSQWLRSEERRERFFRGARRMAALDHPGIVRIELPKAEDLGYSFYVMEHLSGGDLKRAVLGKALDRDNLLRVVGQVAAGLHYAHEHGLVHRDVKPENILLDGNGRAALTDFDLVHAFDTTGGTRTMVSMGTVFYAAPEAQEDAKDADRRADVYSLGVTAIFVLLGRNVTLTDFRDWGGCIERLDAAPAVRDVLRRAVAYERSERFETCAAFAEALANAVTPARQSQAEVIAPVVPRADDPFQAELRAAGLEWVEIPAGWFLMGSDDDESFDDERPVRRVYVSAFAMSRYPVTNALYGLFLGDEQAASIARDQESRVLADARSPVVDVSWSDATAFCAWLGRRTGELVRLPTEAEWEYACRAGSTDARYGELDAIAWHHGNSCARVHSVGEKLPNAWGIEDMLGNVYEWCRDWYGPYDGHDVNDPAGPGQGPSRVVRGGSWISSVRFVRAALRYARPSVSRHGFIGFRLARGQGAFRQEPDSRDRG